MNLTLNTKKLLYFESETFTDPDERATEEAFWYKNYFYKHLRDYLAMESLKTKTFSHRFFKETFLSMIPPHSIRDEGEAQEAQRLVARLKPSMMSTLNANLWKKWKPIEDVVVLVGGDTGEAFVRFLFQDYYPTMKETLEDCGQNETFTPPVAVTVFAASAVEVAARERIVAAASMANHSDAMRCVQEAYENLKSTCNPSQLKVLPQSPPNKFTADHYFKALEKEVNKGSHPRPSQEHSSAYSGSVVTVNDVASASSENISSMPVMPSRGTSSSQGSIDALLSGNGFDAPVPAVGPHEYVSSLQLLTEGVENSQCKFQACLVVCAPEPREIQYAEESPRKR